MTDTKTVRTSFRGRGPLLQNARVTGLVTSVLLIAIARVPSRPALSVCIAAGMFVLWQTLLLRPRVVIDGEEICIYRVFRTVRRPVASVKSVDLLSGNVLWYPTKELWLVLDDQVIFFPWIGWYDSAESWFSLPSADRQRTFREKLNAAIAAAKTP